MRRRLPILVFLCALLGCTPPPPECLGLEALGLDLGDLLEESDPEEPDFPAFALGVEYAQSGLGSTYAGTGVGWAKTRLEVFSWQTTEPSAPRDGVHDYDWRCTDAEVAEWQQAGVTRLQASLNPSSSWGSRSTTGDIRPKEDREDEYRAWVGALIERYDGDGVDDMPGLVRPVRHWVVGGEWSSFWPSDDAPGYLEVLEMTREEARAASEEVLLGSIPFLLLDVFEGNEPSPEQVSTRLEDPPSVLRNSTEGMHAILDRPELFDYVDVHSLGDYTELPPLAAWLRAEMAARDYDKPLWIDDAYSISFLANRYWPAVHPVAEEDYEAVYGVLDAVASYESEAGEEWLRAEAAKGVVHKGATALGEGFVGVQLGNTEDWMPDSSLELRRSAVSFLGAGAMLGMVDTEQSGSYAQVRSPGAARPALRNLALMAELFGDGAFDSSERIGGTEGVRGYRFERSGEPLWVLWSEDGVLQLPGEEEGTELLELALPEGRFAFEVTWAVTEGSAPDPRVNRVQPVGGVLRLELDSTPVFVRLVPES